MTQTNPKTIATGAARLRAEISGHLACVTISYPERHNIIDLEGWLAFPDLMAQLTDNPDVRLIVLRGAGMAKLASSRASRISHANASPSPPPMQ